MIAWESVNGGYRDESRRMERSRQEEEKKRKKVGRQEH